MSRTLPARSETDGDVFSPSLTVPGVAPIQDPNHPQDLNSTNDASLNAGVNAIAKGFSEIGAGHLSAPVFIPKTPMPDGSSPQYVQASPRVQFLAMIQHR